MNLNKFKNNFLSKINRGYGYKNYPEKFKFKFYLKKKIFSEKKNLKKKAGNNFNLELPSKNILVNPIDIWNKKNFKDREDFSALHRWTWIIKVLSKKKKNSNIKNNKFRKNNYKLVYNISIRKN